MLNFSPRILYQNNCHGWACKQIFLQVSVQIPYPPTSNQMADNCTHPQCATENTRKTLSSSSRRWPKENSCTTQEGNNTGYIYYYTVVSHSLTTRSITPCSQHVQKFIPFYFGDPGLRFFKQGAKTELKARVCRCRAYSEFFMTLGTC